MNMKGRAYPALRFLGICNVLQCHIILWECLGHRYFNIESTDSMMSKSCMYALQFLHRVIIKVIVVG